jgi:hypothetical protein
MPAATARPLDQAPRSLPRLRRPTADPPPAWPARSFAARLGYRHERSEELAQLRGFPEIGRAELIRYLTPARLMRHSCGSSAARATCWARRCSCARCRGLGLSRTRPPRRRRRRQARRSGWGSRSASCAATAPGSRPAPAICGSRPVPGLADDGRRGVEGARGVPVRRGDGTRCVQVLTAPLSGRQVLCPPPSVVRGCDPCRPGTALQWSARDEVRTNDLDVGGQWNCLETATAMTECGRAMS